MAEQLSETRSIFLGETLITDDEKSSEGDKGGHLASTFFREQESEVLQFRRNFDLQRCSMHTPESALKTVEINSFLDD
jgi:hypothetical protein